MKRISQTIKVAVELSSIAPGFSKHPTGQVSTWVLLVLFGICGLGGIGYWQFAPTEFRARVSGLQEADLTVSYDEFRTLLVRESPTKSIVEHGGMKLLDEQILDVQVDASNDRRPLVNALLRQSKTNVDAQKRLRVELTDVEIDAKALTLIQTVHITPMGLEVVSESEESAGELTLYKNTLVAAPDANQTKLTVKVEMELSKSISPLFHAHAKSRLQTAANKAAAEEIEALREFTMLHARK